MLDIIIRIILIYFLYRGWHKGFLRTLLGPLALVLSVILCFIYYNQTGKMLITALIGMFGPIIITIGLSLLLNIWQKTVNNDEPISLFSRFCGSIFSVAWGGMYIMLFLILIMKIPINSGEIKEWQTAIRKTQTYSLVQKWMPYASVETKDIISDLNDPEKFKKIKDAPQFKDLLNNETFKEFLEDEEIQRQIKEKDISGLMSNPKMQKIFQDKKLLQQLLEANKLILDQSLQEKQNPKGTAENNFKMLELPPAGGQ